jgi:serine/threonine protein kinase
MEDLGYFERRLGTTLRGKWRLERLLGVGGMAAVYEATHVKLGRRDAIKILHPTVACSADARQRFEQEAQAVNQLQHAGAVCIHDIEVSEEGAPFLVMELLQGQSLAERLRTQGPVNPRELFGWMDTVLDVLGAAHRAGIVHRDIKPDNLFLTSDGGVKVLDFGVARLRQQGAPGDPTRTGALIGTVAYMAPEQVSGRSDLDGRADLFAVGATMFRLLTGRHLHPTENDLQLILQMATEPAPPISSLLPGLPSPFAQVVDRALALERDQRFPDAVAMQMALRQALASPVTDTPHEPPLAPSPAAPLCYEPTGYATRLPASPSVVAPPTPSIHHAPAILHRPGALSPLPPPPAPAPAWTRPLERIGRQSVSLPIPAAIALLAVLGLLFASLGSMLVWKFLHRAPPADGEFLGTPAEKPGEEAAPGGKKGKGK